MADRETLALALARLAVVPVIFVGAHAVDDAPPADAFDIVAALAGLYALAVLVRVAAVRTPPRLLGYAAVDLLFVALLAYLSGAATELRYVFAVFPVIAAFVARPLYTAAWAALALFAYGFVSLLPPVSGDPPEAGTMISHVLALAWPGALAVTLAFLIVWRRERLAKLATSRQALVAQLLGAEAAERRRLSYALHDEAVQNLLAARQELAAAKRGEPDCLDRARVCVDRTVQQLRETIAGLHPQLLEGAGLAAALSAVADEHARRSGFHVVVSVEEGATGIHDDLVYALVRELVLNAAKHADADNVTIDVARRPGVVRVTVSDDGRGLDPARRQAAVEEGHIGLASSEERVAALGGSFEISASPGRGTRIHAAIPVSRPFPKGLPGPDVGGARPVPVGVRAAHRA